MSLVRDQLQRLRDQHGAKLLSRDEFREGVFLRDGHRCVICGEPAQDAHHILERRLWSGNQTGGYFLDNGASVCGVCHIRCEETTISVEQVREAAGITALVLPEHMYRDVTYDKWGNPCLANGTRLRGELFDDESVQKILNQGQFLGQFVNYVKYPRTHHVPWSPGRTKDDRVLTNMNQFHGRRVIVTEKMDGENTSMYSDHVHARSVDSANDPSRNVVKRIWSDFGYDIPDRWRICGENLYEKHSIFYDDLPSFFMGFSIWDEGNNRLGYDEMLEWFNLFGIHPAPLLYDGIYDEELIQNLPRTLNWDMDKHEGYTVTVADKIHYSEFKHLMGKFVRANHVTSEVHVRSRRVLVPNLLKEQNERKA